MCRHLAPVGNVTFRESDTPRGRALLIDRILANPRLLESSDFRDAIYDADLSAACRAHCVSHYDEAGLILAARRDIVEAGWAPPAVQALIGELAGAEVRTRGDSAAEIVYYEDGNTAVHQPEISAAIEHILKAAGISHRIVSSADTGKALKVLGCLDGARALAAKVVQAVGTGPTRILVTSCPAAYDAFRTDYAALGAALGEGVEVLHSSDFILRLLSSGRLKCKLSAALKVFPLASDYFRNYCGVHGGIGQLLDVLGIEALPFGSNQEESFTAGEGAVVLDRLNPRLVEKLSRYVVDRIENRAEDVLLTASPYTKYALLKFGGEAIHLTTIEEVVRGLI